MWYIILAVVHLLVCLCIYLGIRSEKLKVHKYMIFVALFLFFWGPLIVLVLHFQILHEADDAIEIDVEKMKMDSELYKSVTVDTKKVAAETVPIEEALLINNAGERRTIIMDVLNDNPKEYIQFLQKAGNNDDTEVVHYAVTAMVEISKENDYKLQDYERQLAADPENADILGKYCAFLWNCLDQNLMQGQVAVMNRELFASLIRRKINIVGNITDYSRMIENDLKRKNYTQATEGLDEMCAHYGDREEYYMLRLQYLASLGRGEEIQELLQEIDDRHIYLSSKSKEVLAFWEM